MKHLPLASIGNGPFAWGSSFDGLRTIGRHPFTLRLSCDRLGTIGKHPFTLSLSKRGARLRPASRERSSVFGSGR